MKKFFNYEYWKDLTLGLGTLAVSLSLMKGDVLGKYYNSIITYCIVCIFVCIVFSTISKFFED